MLGFGAMAIEPVLPTARFDISSFGELVGDPSRVAILLALMDGSARPATELADIAGVTRSTASAHLRRLLEGRLIVVDVRGRHRYFRLAGDEVADALEAVALIRPLETRARSPARLALAEARTCYHHLAGRLGVALADTLVMRGHIALVQDGGEVSEDGLAFLSNLGVALDERGHSRRVFCRPCLDWSERRVHIAGSVGAKLCERCFELGWIKQLKTTRALEVTAKGSRGFAEWFGIDLAAEPNIARSQDPAGS